MHSPNTSPITTPTSWLHFDGSSDHHRSDDYAGVRPHAAHRQPALWRHPEPTPPRSHAGRIVGRQCGGRRIRLRAPRRGQRHGRLGSHPRGVVRDRRPEAGARADPDGRPARLFDSISHHGPLARCADDARLFLSADPGPGRRRHPLCPWTARPLRPARSGCPRHAPGVVRRPRGAGLSTRRSRPRSRRRRSSLPQPVLKVDVVDPAVTPDDEAAWVELWQVFMAANYGELVAAHRERMDPEVLRLIAAGESMSAVRYKRLERVRNVAVAPAAQCARRPRCPAVPDDGPAAMARGEGGRCTRATARPRLRLTGHDLRLQPGRAAPGVVGAVRAAPSPQHTPASPSGCRSSGRGGGKTSCCASPVPCLRELRRVS